MDLGLKGKKALVTGGSRGIGYTIANQFAEEGVAVAICARKADGLKEAAEALRAKGVTVFSKTVDVGNGPDYKAFITAAAEALGGLDIFIHNVSAMVSQGEQGWERSFQLAASVPQRKWCGSSPLSPARRRAGSPAPTSSLMAGNIRGWTNPD